MPGPAPPAVPRWTRRSFLHLALAGAAAAIAPRPAGAVPSPGAPGRLALYNVHTREALEVTFRDAAGRYDEEALTAIDRVLRCHHTGRVIPIDRATLDILAEVRQRVGGDREVHVISGFRSPEYNAWLLRRGHAVARQSLHLVGKAIDVRLPGVALAHVRQAALALERGGVGYYPRSDFVHLDSGRVRAW